MNSKEAYVVFEGENIAGIYTNDEAAQECIDVNPTKRFLDGPYPIQRFYDKRKETLLSEESEPSEEEEEDLEGYHEEEEDVLDFGGDEPEDPYGD